MSELRAQSSDEIRAIDNRKATGVWEMVKLPREKLQCGKEHSGAWDSAHSLAGWKRSLREIQADF